MLSAPRLLRDLVEEPGFRAQKLKIFGSEDAAEDALEAALWALTTDPAIGRYPQVSHGGAQAIKTIATKNHPAVLVIFTIENSGERVRLHMIRPPS
ncbi:MAG TPA: hypothetical protein VEA41_09975 [Salinarimonas sp.]|nr:hypothetical protein [Salinarimonas sp.]